MRSGYLNELQRCQILKCPSIDFRDVDARDIKYLYVRKPFEVSVFQMRQRVAPLRMYESQTRILLLYVDLGLLVFRAETFGFYGLRFSFDVLPHSCAGNFLHDSFKYPKPIRCTFHATATDAAILSDIDRLPIVTRLPFPASNTNTSFRMLPSAIVQFILKLVKLESVYALLIASLMLQTRQFTQITRNRYSKKISERGSRFRRSCLR